MEYIRKAACGFSPSSRKGNSCWHGLGLGGVAAFLMVFVSWTSAAQTVGVTLHPAMQREEGFTLFAPGSSTNTYLINSQGELIQRWSSAYYPGMACYLLEDGHLFRCARSNTPGFNGGGRGGRVEEFDWEGRLQWAYEYATPQHRQHHDAIKLPNGNVLMIAWELKSTSECVAAGRNPAILASAGLWPEHVIEVQPTGETGGVIVWEWHVWDHLVQDLDPAQENYGEVGSHPERIDINYISNGNPDFLHMNGIDYNPALDQIMLSVLRYNEIWIIDHSTTSAEAAGRTGGRSGRGGDILYRWGNPATYRAGTAADQQLFGQHNPQWLKDDQPGAGHILVFNNGSRRPEGNYSTVEEIVPPLDSSKLYARDEGAAYGPSGAVWSYAATPPSTFYAANVSGAQRLSNGHTLICDGPRGVFFEVTSQGETVWRYVCPVTSNGILTQGAWPPNQNLVFRATRYSPDYAGLAGRTLSSHGLVELPATPDFRLTGWQDFRLTWTSLPDRTYVVEWTDAIPANPWSALGTVRSIGTQSHFSDVASSAENTSQGYYRVRLLP